MGFFRFRRSIKIAPGIRLNLSKSGVSASIGPKGFATNIKHGRNARTTAGLPGTGLSYTETRGESREAAPPAAGGNGGAGFGRLFVLLALLAWWII